MFCLGIFLGLWIALLVYGLSHDVRRLWHEHRLRRFLRKRERGEQALQDLRESFRAVIH